MVDSVKHIWGAIPSEVGGWSVIDVESFIHTGAFAPVADFTTRELALHIVGLHNNWVKDQDNG